LVRPGRGEKQARRELIEETRARIFFLEYAPISTTSAATGENIDSVFASIDTIRRAAHQRIGTGILNRLLRQAFEANPPPLVKGRRLKLFYTTQTRSGGLQSAEKALAKVPRVEKALQVPEFVLFVNDPSLLNETYRRYLEARIRKTKPYPGLPIILTLRQRTGMRHNKQR
jgi:GTPase